MDGKEPNKLQVIIDALLTGDSHQHAIVRRRLLAYVAGRIRRSEADVEDIVGDILATLIDSLQNDRFRGRSIPEFNGYLYSIARFKILQFLDRAAANPDASNPSSHDTVADPIGRNPHDTTSANDLARKVYEGLDPRCREFLRLRFEEGWTDQEIADLRGMTKNAVSTSISRCLKKARSIEAVRENMYQKPPNDDIRKGE